MFWTGKGKNAIVAFGLACFTLLPTVKADVLPLGTFNNGQCYPFYCNGGGTTAPTTITYEEYYGSTWFPGPITITSITFPGDPNVTAKQALSGNYKVTLSEFNDPNINTNGLNAIPPVITGVNAQVFYNGSVSAGVNPDTSLNDNITLNGITPYSYNPSTGGLLLTITITNQQSMIGTGGGVGANEADYQGTAVPTDHGVIFRAYDTPATPVSDVSGSNQFTNGGGGGLVTDFTYTLETTPEPSFYGFLGLSLVGLLLIAQRRSVKG